MAPEGDLVRRPILDARLRTVAYELWTGDGSGAGFADDMTALGAPTYLRVSGRALLGGFVPPAGVRGLVLDGHGGGDELAAVLREQQRRAIEIVVDCEDPAAGVVSPVLALADILRLRTPDGTPPRRLVAPPAGRADVRLLAGGVDCYVAFGRLRDAGYDLFQGRFFQHAGGAGTADGDIPTGTIGALAELQTGGGDLDVLEDVIRNDVGLSYRLLRYVNSAAIGLPRTVGSVRHAILLLGVRAVRQWATSLVLAGIKGRPHALLSSALIRARTCELLFAPYGPADADRAFTVGLFSLLGAIMGTDAATALASLPLDEEVRAAIVDHDGALGRALQKVIAYEHGAFDDPVLAGHARTAVGLVYLDALQWADAMLHAGTQPAEPAASAGRAPALSPR